MSGMVERVARAIAAEDTQLPPSGANKHADLYLRHARAAIAAMREPSEAMIDAGWNSGGSCGSHRCWNAMIDAALEKREPTGMMRRQLGYEETDGDP